MAVGILLMIVTVICATCVWPVGRWVARNEGRSVHFGFWTVLSGGLISGVLCLVLHQSVLDPLLWKISAVVAVAYVVGYFLIILLAGTGGTTQLALHYLPAELVFPFTVAGPIVLVLILGRLFYHERLSRMAFFACILSITGLLLLTLGQR